MQRHIRAREYAVNKHVLTRAVTSQIIPTWSMFTSNIKKKDTTIIAK